MKTNPAEPKNQPQMPQIAANDCNEANPVPPLPEHPRTPGDTRSPIKQSMLPTLRRPTLDAPRSDAPRSYAALPPNHDFMSDLDSICPCRTLSWPRIDCSPMKSLCHWLST